MNIGKRLYNSIELSKIEQEISQEIETKLYSFGINNFEETIHVIGILKGCYLFHSHISEMLAWEHQVDFIHAKSYKGDKKQKGMLQLNDLGLGHIKNCHVFLLDTIVDSGETMVRCRKAMSVHQPKSVTTVALFKRYNSPFKPDIVGRILETDKFIVGYGLDYFDNYRGWAGIFELDEE